MTELPKSNHAIQISKTGGPEVIEFKQIGYPSPKPDEILIKVEWAGVNFIDTYLREGIYPIFGFPYTIGIEAAGTILALPASKEVLNNGEYQSRNFKVGDKVVINDSGAFVNYLAIHWEKVGPLPEGVSTKVAAATIVSGLTALTFLREAYAVKPNDWVLIHAVAGGFGLQAAQLAKKFGARVIGTTSTPEKAALAKQYGADHVILYTQEDVVKKVLEFTGGNGVQAIYDGVGKDTWEDNFKSIALKGTIVTMGNSSGVVPPFSPSKLRDKNLKLCRPSISNYIIHPEERLKYTREYFSYIANGSVRVLVHKEYPFAAEGVAQAHKDLAGRGTVGKLLIKVDSE